MNTEQLSEYVYEPFAESEEYKEVNRSIIGTWIDAIAAAGSRGVSTLLDLGSGVGTMVQLFLERLPHGWAQPAVVCVDMSDQALEQARSRLNQSVQDLRVIAGRIEEVEMDVNAFDVAIWGNGIHYLDEAAQLTALEKVRDSLKDGGWFFFDTAFTAESRPPETIPFYRAQVAKAIRYLKSIGAKRAAHEAAPESSRFLSASYYADLMRRVGLTTQTMRSVAVRLYQTAWEHISGFAQYAAGALHGYREDLAATAMRQAVAPAIEEYGLRDEHNRPFVPRAWLAGAARVFRS